MKMDNRRRRLIRASIAIAYNALPGQQLQQGFMAWAKQRYRAQWDEAMKSGRRMNEFSLCQFKMDRDMRAERKEVASK